MRKLHLSLLTAVVAASMILSVQMSATAANPKYLTYKGQLLDHQGEPVSGIYRLSFSLHKTPTATKKIWKEPHEVAISNGSYSVMLGYQTTLPKQNFGRMYLSVSLIDGPELVREPVSSILTKIATKKTPLNKIKQPTRAENKTKPSSYAKLSDKAEFAVEAGNSERLEGRNLDEVAQYINEKNGIKKVRVGKGRPNNDHIGGEGGGEFITRCPSGYVVVGIQGYAGRYIDGVDLLCAPLKLD